jgi:hypothetical protein
MTARVMGVYNPGEARSLKHIPQYQALVCLHLIILEVLIPSGDLSWYNNRTMENI